MKSRSMIRIAAAFCLALAVGAVAQAQAKKNLTDEIQQSEKAARVFREIMDTPDKGIPRNYWMALNAWRSSRRSSKPDSFLAGVADGVASCRTAVGWSAPAFFNLGGGSLLQIGAQSTDFRDAVHE